ncbi:hypothetical protein C8R47DRAFT_1078743 [Mycena vitilis]|nr:hypothetical protein C8R47DRAFT_1078743 [Mycena vitilis]
MGVEKLANLQHELNAFHKVQVVKVTPRNLHANGSLGVGGDVDKVYRPFSMHGTGEVQKSEGGTKVECERPEGVAVNIHVLGKQKAQKRGAFLDRQQNVRIACKAYLLPEYIPGWQMPAAECHRGERLWEQEERRWAYPRFEIGRRVSSANPTCSLVARCGPANGELENEKANKFDAIKGSTKFFSWGNNRSQTSDGSLGVGQLGLKGKKATDRGNVFFEQGAPGGAPAAKIGSGARHGNACIYGKFAGRGWPKLHPSISNGGDEAAEAGNQSQAKPGSAFRLQNVQRPCLEMTWLGEYIAMPGLIFCDSYARADLPLNRGVHALRSDRKHTKKSQGQISWSNLPITAMPPPAGPAPANLQAVVLGDDGFPVGTPEDWKPILLAAEPAEIIVSQYMKLCELGNVLIKAKNCRPHPLQRPTIHSHVDRIAAELQNNNNQHRTYPVTVIADEEPVFQSVIDESPFNNLDGTLTNYQVVCGCHRIGGLGVYCAETGEDVGWLAHVLHPCLLQIHTEHIRRIIAIDNFASDDAKLVEPGPIRDSFLHSLDIVIEAWKRLERNQPSFHMIPKEAPRLALFSGRISKKAKRSLTSWKLSVRILMRSPSVLAPLRQLFRLPGTLSNMSDQQLCDFLWTIATHSIGSELTLARLLHCLMENQTALNARFNPNGFDFFQMWDSLFAELDAGDGAGPSREQLEQLELGLHEGTWDRLFESTSEFYDRMDGLELLLPTGQRTVNIMPTHHVACLRSTQHDHEGWLITVLHRARVGIRIMCLLLFGPKGILEYSDPSPQSLMVAANGFTALLQTTTQNRLSTWLHVHRPAVGDRDARMQAYTSFIRDTTNELCMWETGEWVISDAIWEALTFASGGVFGAFGVPLPADDQPRRITEEDIPAIAAIANRILGSPLWHSLLIDKWGLRPGKPFEWAPMVLVTELTPEQAEAEAFEREVEAGLKEARKRAASGQLRLQAEFAEAVEERDRLEGKRRETEEAQAALVEKETARLDARQAKAEEKQQRQRAELTEAADSLVAEAKDEAETAAAKAARIAQELARENAKREALPDTLDVDAMSREELVSLLKNQGIPVELNPYSVRATSRNFGEPLLVPCATQRPRLHASEDEDEGEDFSTTLRSLFVEAAEAVSKDTLDRMLRLADRVPQNEAEALLMGAMRAALRGSPTPSPRRAGSSTQSSTRSGSAMRALTPKRVPQSPSASWASIRQSEEGEGEGTHHQSAGGSHGEDDEDVGRPRSKHTPHSVRSTKRLRSVRSEPVSPTKARRRPGSKAGRAAADVSRQRSEPAMQKQSQDEDSSDDSAPRQLSYCPATYPEEPEPTSSPFIPPARRDSMRPPVPNNTPVGKELVPSSSQSNDADDIDAFSSTARSSIAQFPTLTIQAVKSRPGPGADPTE